MSLILVGAHPKTIDYDNGELLTKHFWGNSIESFIQKNKINKPIKIETIDLLPGGTYQQDIFDDIFVKEHYETYHQIYLIDCGGIWYVLQTLDISESRWYNTPEINEMREIMRKLSHEELTEIIKELIQKLYSMLKPDGICVLSKFTNCFFREQVICILDYVGFQYETEQHKYINDVIIIKKYNQKI